jgi:hypothetical protein
MKALLVRASYSRDLSACGGIWAVQELGLMRGELREIKQILAAKKAPHRVAWILGGFRFQPIASETAASTCRVPL